MTPAEFSQAKHILGFGTTRLAAMLCVTPRAIQHWQSGKDPVSPLAAKVLRLMVAGKINPKDLEDEMSGKRIIEGMQQALAWVRGEGGATLHTPQDIAARRAAKALEAGDLAAYHCLSENAKWPPDEWCLLKPGTCPGCIAKAQEKQT